MLDDHVPGSIQAVDTSSTLPVRPPEVPDTCWQGAESLRKETPSVGEKILNGIIAFSVARIGILAKDRGRLADTSATVVGLY